MVVPLQARAEFFGGDLSHWFQFNLKGGIVWIEIMKGNIVGLIWYELKFNDFQCEVLLNILIELNEWKIQSMKRNT
jgi:hypothetical protein